MNPIQKTDVPQVSPAFKAQWFGSDSDDIKRMIKHIESRHAERVDPIESKQLSCCDRHAADTSSTEEIQSDPFLPADLMHQRRIGMLIGFGISAALVLIMQILLFVTS